MEKKGRTGTALGDGERASLLYLLAKSSSARSHTIFKLMHFVACSAEEWFVLVLFFLQLVPVRVETAFRLECSSSRPAGILESRNSQYASVQCTSVPKVFTVYFNDIH